MRLLFPIRRISFIASLLVGLLVNLPLVTLFFSSRVKVYTGMPVTAFFLARLGFHIVLAFFFIEFHRYVLTQKPAHRLGRLAWYSLHVFLFLVITALFILLVRPWAPERPLLLALTSYFRGFLVWGTALLIGYFLTILEQNRRIELENEWLKRQSLQSQLDTLRAQLNPHFLFNSLNTLGSLIREGDTQSQPYLARLSQVLRYSLQVQQQKLIPFTEEVQFTMAYTFLLTMRFGKNLFIENQLPPDAPWLIPPMALQTVIENAVKHNVISKAMPLHIVLALDPTGQYVVVRNRYQPKPEPAEGTGVGLPNLESRFRLLSGKSIQISRTEDEFIVYLPLIPFS